MSLMLLRVRHAQVRQHIAVMLSMCESDRNMLEHLCMLSVPSTAAPPRHQHAQQVRQPWQGMHSVARGAACMRYYPGQQCHQTHKAA